MRVGLDLDGVIYNWTKAAAMWLNNECGESKWDPDEAPHHWGQFKNLYGDELWNNLWERDNAIMVFAEARPFYGASWFVNTLSKDHDVRVITSRPVDVRRVTLLNWLNDFPGCEPLPSFFFSPTRFIANKTEMACDVYIDDHPYAGDINLLSSSPVVLLDRPYNKKARDVIRVSDYQEVMNEIAKLERN